MSTRPIRVCDACYQVDTHPRHDHWLEVPEDVDPSKARGVSKLLPDGPEGDVQMEILFDPFHMLRHLDCCAAKGCPIPTGEPGNCNDRLIEMGGKHGDQLVKSVESAVRAAEKLEA